MFFYRATISPKIRVLPSGTLSQTPDLENFTTMASRSRSQVVNKARRRVVDGRVCGCLGAYYKSTNSNPQTLLLRFVVDLLYKLFL